MYCEDVMVKWVHTCVLVFYSSGLEPNEYTGVTRGADKKCSSRLIRTDATLDLEVRERMNCGVTCRHKLIRRKARLLYLFSHRLWKDR